MKKENLVIRRLKSETPLFFKKVKKVLLGIAGSVALAMGALYALPSDVQSLIPIWILKYAGLTVFFMTLMGSFIADLTTTDKD